MDRLVTTDGASILYSDIRERMGNNMRSVEQSLSKKVDGARVEDGYLILTAGDDEVAKLTGFGGGGGGGGSDNDAKLTVINQSGSLPSAISLGASYIININWSSIENDIPTGPGTILIRVNGQAKIQSNIEQGDYIIDMKPYLVVGSNTIRITITDIYSNSKSIAFSVNVISYSLTAERFDSSIAYNDDITYIFTAKGEGTKTMHFIVDGVEIGTKAITTTGREDSYVIPKQPHGVHYLETYFTADIGASEVKSNTLNYALICYDEGNDTPIIACVIDEIEIDQYSTISIPYYVYNAVYSTSEIDYYIDGELINHLTDVPRTRQLWNRRADKQGNHIYTIRSGVTSKDIRVKIAKVNVEVEAETQNLSLHLSSEGRSNNEPAEQRSTWEYNGIKAQFENFNWSTDGWVLDDQGLTTLRVKDDARITIPYKPFSTEYRDIKNTGKTLEFEFATSGVFDYDTEIISCYSNGRGFRITAQQALYASSVSSLNTQYKENEHVRIGFVINSTSNNSFIYCYINGIISGLIRYPSTDIFYQNPAVDIKIGSSDAIVDLYRIRIYDKDLSRFQVVNNWIADMQDGQQLLNEYNRNAIYDDSDNLDLEKIKTHLPTLPYIVVYTDQVTDKKGNLVGHLPEYKGQKLLVSGYYVDPVNAANSFSWKNGEIDVQGTSSQAYPIKNFKLKIKQAKTYKDETTRKPTDCSGFILTQASEKEGKEVTVKKYPLRGYGPKGEELSIPTNTFVYKADYASSEGANNVELVRYYNDVCSGYAYKTPPQDKDSRIRQGIDGFPMVWFEEKNGKISFIGKYNFNNHKGTEEVYGLDYHGETFEETEYSDYDRTVVGVPDESWEITDNNSMIAQWRRVAGTATKQNIQDSEGQAASYDTYIKKNDDGTDGDYLARVKAESLTPIYNGTHADIVNENYANWVSIWQDKYDDVEAWINGMSILKIHDSGESMDESVREQRDFVIEIMKSDIRTMFNLTEITVQVSPEEDMLGEYGMGESVAHSFEVRFPGEWYDAHVEGFPEVIKVERMVNFQKWIVSTDPAQATNTTLDPEVTYNGVTYTTDNQAYRLAKFKAELNKYFNIPDTIFYYIYTEIFLMIDSRVKNAFPSYFAITEAVQATDPNTGELMWEECKPDDTASKKKTYYKRSESEPYTYEEFPIEKDMPTVDDNGNPLYLKIMTERELVDKNGWPLGRWCWLPYDMDTGIGINNEGLLVFDYSLEDTEALKGSQVVPIGTSGSTPVYNGAASVMWNNLRKTFSNEINAAYTELRTGALFNYDEIEKRYEDHQYMWPAAIFNEDAYYKYIKPLLDTGEDRLGMCLGSKEQQRKWWLFNRFRFIDSKYTAGDAVDNTINFRVNNLEGDKTIKITPYIDLYIKVKQGEQWQSTPVKVYRNQETSVFIDVPEAGDTEAYIYSADQIKEVRGLNQNLHISTLDIRSAQNLQHLDVSSTTENRSLAALTVGANKLLRTIDARNCKSLGDTSLKYYTTSVDLSQCEQLEEAYFTGTQLLTVMLPEGGRLRKIYLPASITTLNIENQSKVKEIQILNDAGEWDTSNIETLIVDNVNSEVQYITLDIIKTLKAGSFIKFYGFDVTLNTLAEFNEIIAKLESFGGTGKEGENVDASLANIQGTIRCKETISYEEYTRILNKYRNLKIDAPVQKTVEFYSWDGNALLDTQYVTAQNIEPTTVVYKGVEPTVSDEDNNIGKTHYVWNGWALTPNTQEDAELLDKITQSIKLYAAFREIPIYSVNFYNYDGSVLLDSGRTYDVGPVKYTKELPTYEDEQFGNVAFLGWGTLKYGSANLRFEDGALQDVDRDIEAYAMMNWPIKSFEITTPPNRVHYWAKYNDYEGDYVDLTGLVATSVKDTPMGEQAAELLTYDYEPKGRLTIGNKTLTISTQGRVDGVDQILTRTVDLHYVTSMSINQAPERTVFFLEEPWDPKGLQLKTIFDDDTEELIDITEKIDEVCNWSPDSLISKGAQYIKVTYKGYLLSVDVFGIEEVTSLEDTDWNTISAISNEGLAPNWWAIGDTKTFYISKDALSAGFGSSWSTGLARLRLIAFDHNMEQESPNKHTVTLELDGFERRITKFQIVDTLPPISSMVNEPGADNTVAIKNGDKYTVWVYDWITRSWNNAGEAELIPAAESDYKEDTLKWWVTSMYSGAPMAFTKSGEENAGIKYSWHKGCNFRDLCDAYYNALPEEISRHIVEVTKGQRDQNFTEYPFELEESQPYRYDYNSVIETQKNKVYVASYMELTGIGRVTVNNPSMAKPYVNADESEVCKQFEYYTLGGAERRVRINVDSRVSVYARSYPTRSYESFRWIPDRISGSAEGYQYNYYSCIASNGEKQTESNSDASTLWAFIPIFTL